MADTLQIKPDLDIHWDADELLSRLDSAAREQLPFAIALSLTRTAQQVQEAEWRVMAQVFDRPTRFTLNSLYLRRAEKRDPTPAAEVYFKDSQFGGGHYLEPHVFGGVRPATPLERRLRWAGILAARNFAILGERAPRDQHGNIRRGQLTKMLADLQGLDPKDNTKDRGAAASRWRVITNKQRSGLQPGIYRVREWTHAGKAVKFGLSPWFIFTSKNPAYRKRFPFFQIAEQVVAARQGPEFTKALDHALATAKK